MSSPDVMLIERLRKENLDQFFTLVRMHLSFVVDICTDDVDGSADKPKQFRWNFNKKTKNSANNSSQNAVNIAKSTAEGNSITEEGISRVYELIDYLSKDDNVTQEGIFRRTGSLSRQRELRQLLLAGSSLNLDEGRFSVHDCASVLKGFLAGLPQPLLMDQYYQTYCTLAAQYPPNVDSSETKLLTALQLLLLLLTPVHRNFLQRLLKLLRMAADNEASNRMSPDTLATMFTPHLLCPRKLSPEVFHTDSVALAPLISFMIRQCNAVFDAPTQLLTDVSAYFTIRERKRMLSPDIDLDESITDRTAANTVYTFVDRNRTNAENETNPTDTALAQLYAHIQALPDSQHKRRLIKQFNRQNGYGTPIQVQRTGKVAGSRSFGDSIKRHIFQKGLLNKTPKKGSGSSVNTVGEKQTPKEKIRFQEDKTDVSHKNVVLKNLASKMASVDCLDEFNSDSSEESTLSDSALNTSKKHSPKFVSEPNLTNIDSKLEDGTPKSKTKRFFRTKNTTQVNKRYQKRSTVKGTPTCVSCVDYESGSDNDVSTTPKKRDVCKELKSNYLTSTPGVSEAIVCNEDCSTPYLNFRRSMSPITKSTQKLSKAMQESIMTPRSRKPLIITSEQRDNLPETKSPAEVSKQSDMYQSISPKNDSDFISSDEENLRTSQYSEQSNGSIRPENTRFVLRRKSPEVTKISLTKPFKEYLLSRSVLTATPVDLSILNKSESDEKITDSMMFCLDGNVPSDLTSFDDKKEDAQIRSPLKNLNFKIDSPNRKRVNTKEMLDCDSKRVSLEKENVNEAFELCETEL